MLRPPWITYGRAARPGATRPTRCAASALRHPPHQVEGLVGRRASEMHQAIAHAEEGGDRADVPDRLVVEAVSAQRLEVGVLDLAAAGRQLHREIQHRALARTDLGLAIVGGE